MANVISGVKVNSSNYLVIQGRNKKVKIKIMYYCLTRVFKLILHSLLYLFNLLISSQNSLTETFYNDIEYTCKLSESG